LSLHPYSERILLKVTGQDMLENLLKNPNFILEKVFSKWKYCAN
jgi:hypothetical protein